jgi:hypothetical protein
MSKTEKEVKTVITGQVVDENRRPAGGLTVLCNGVSTRTLFDGSFRFEGLAPGNHIIETNLDGYTRLRVEVEVVEGEESVFDLQLIPEVGNARVYGYVFEEETREPLKTGGSMYMFRPTFNTNVPINPTTGYFEFNDLPAGTYTLWTSALEYNDVRKTITVEEGEERREDFTITKAWIEPPLG